MECIYCGAQWVLRDGQTKLANCPFCGKALMIEKAEERYTDLPGALKAIAEMRGTEILVSRPQVVLGMFMDLASDLKREFRLLKLFYENGTEKFFADSAKVTEGQLNMAVRSLQENVFMDAGSARHIVNVFALVLGIKDQVQETVFKEQWQPVSPKSGQKENIEEKKEQWEEENGEESSPLEGVICAKDLKRGMYIELDQEICRIFSSYQRFYRAEPSVEVKLKNIRNDKVSERFFKLSEKCKTVQIDKKKMQYLYSRGGHHIFRDSDTSDLLELNDEIVGDEIKFIRENDEVSVEFYEGKAVFFVPPNIVERKVVEIGHKGKINQFVRTETGEITRVPISVKIGDKIRVRFGEGNLAVKYDY